MSFQLLNLIYHKSQSVDYKQLIIYFLRHLARALKLNWRFAIGSKDVSEREGGRERVREKERKKEKET